MDDPRYVVQRLLAKGGMGEVYLAHDQAEGRDVVLKTLRADVSKGLAARARLKREVEALRATRHPNLVELYGMAEVEGGVALVLEYVDGPALSAVCRDHPLRPGEALALGRQLAGALAALHAAGVMHRDLTPHNVVRRSDGSWVLVDLGLAYLVGAATMTATGIMVGKPSYLAPEAVQAGTRGTTQDVWQLGATIFEALTGRRRLPGRSLQECFENLVKEKFAPLPSDPAACPPALRAALEVLLDTDPSRRPPDGPGALALLEGVDLAAPAPGPGAAVPGRGGPDPLPEAGPSRAPLALAAVAVGFGLGLGFLGGGPRPAADPLAPPPAEGVALAAARRPAPDPGLAPQVAHGVTAQRELRLPGLAPAVVWWQGAPLATASLPAGTARVPVPAARRGAGTLRWAPAGRALDLPFTFFTQLDPWFRASPAGDKAVVRRSWTPPRPHQVPPAAQLRELRAWSGESMMFGADRHRGRRVLSVLSHGLAAWRQHRNTWPPGVPPLGEADAGYQVARAGWPAGPLLHDAEMTQETPDRLEASFLSTTIQVLEEPRNLRARSWARLPEPSRQAKGSMLWLAVRLPRPPAGAWVRFWTSGTVDIPLVVHFPPVLWQAVPPDGEDSLVLGLLVPRPSIGRALGYLAVDVLGGRARPGVRPADRMRLILGPPGVWL